MILNAMKNALEALKENHEFHIDHDDYNGYPGSHLWDVNTKTIELLMMAILIKERMTYNLYADKGSENG